MAVVVVDVGRHAGASSAELADALRWERLLLERAEQASTPSSPAVPGSPFASSFLWEAADGCTRPRSP